MSPSGQTKYTSLLLQPAFSAQFLGSVISCQSQLPLFPHTAWFGSAYTVQGPGWASSRPFCWSWSWPSGPDYPQLDPRPGLGQGQPWVPDPLIFSSKLIFFSKWSNFDILLGFYIFVKYQCQFLLVEDKNRTIGFVLNDAKIWKERAKIERVIREVQF